MQDRPTFGALSNQGLCHLCSVANTTENLSEIKFPNKIQLFGLWRKNTYHTIFIYGKMLIIEFSYQLLYVWNCMKLYEKKFPIHEKCMISIFGQPGCFGETFIETRSELDIINNIYLRKMEIKINKKKILKKISDFSRLFFDLFRTSQCQGIIKKTSYTRSKLLYARSLNLI